MKILVLIIFGLFSCIASAEWTYIGTGSGGDVTYYDKSRTKSFPERNVVQSWTLVNLSKPEFDSPTNKTYLSTIAREQFFCLEEKSAIEHLIAYSKKNGDGMVVFNEEFEPLKKRAVVPGTIGEKTFRIFCKSR